MKNTRNLWRVVTLALALVMLFSVVACGNTEEPAATTEADGTTTAAPSTTQKPATTEKPTTATTEKPTTSTTATEGTGTTGGDDPVVTPPADDLSQPDVWDGSMDESWFDINNPQTEYTFTTAEQFAGFINIRQAQKGKYYFEGVTIKLARDIILNEGTAEEIKEKIALGQARGLTALHSSQALFKGTFDGQGHTISGAFLDCTSSGYKALFGGIGDNAVIKNLNVTNSYFNGTDTADKVAGAIVVARALGTNMLLSNITVEGALLEESTSAFSGVGILVANLDDASELTIENCHTAGTINFLTKGTNGGGFGGIIGTVDAGTAEKLDEATATVIPTVYTKLTMKNCTSSATINGVEFCGGLVGTIGDLVELKMDYKCKFTGTITVGEVTKTDEAGATTTVPGNQGDYVGNTPDFAPTQPVIIPELTGEDFSAFKYPEFDNAIVIEAASAEAGSVVMTATENKAYHIFNKDGSTGAAAHGIYKLAQGTNPDGTPLYHYYIDLSNVNKSIASNYGDEYKIDTTEDCYIRWTFTVTEAGTYTFGSYMRLKNNADRACQIQIDDQTPFIMHYTLSADEVVNDDASTTQGAYMLWDGVEVELEAGEHTITYTLPSAEYRQDADGKDVTSSWHWRTIYVMKKAA